MKLRNRFLSLFFLFAILGNAQNDSEISRQIDSLRLVVSTASHDTIKVNALLNWSNLIYQTDQQADFHVNKKVEKLCRDNLKKKLNKKLKRFYTMALMECLNNMGGNLMDMGDYKNAIVSYKEALNLSFKIKDKITEAASYTGLGNVYGEMGDHDKAVKYYRKGLAVHLKNKSYDKTSAVYNNLGLEASSRKFPDSALYYYRKSLKYTDFEEYPYDYITTLNNISSVYYELRIDDSARISYEFCIRKSDSLGYKDLKALACNNYANLLSELGKLEEAEKLYLEAENLAIQSNMILYSLDANDGLYSLYMQKGDFKKAINCLERKMLLQDSLYNEETKNWAIQEAFQLDYDRIRIQDSVDAAKQKEISDLQIKSKNDELANEKNKQIFFFFGIGLVILFAVFMYNRFRVTRKQKGIIEEQKILVEEKQKEILDSITYAKRIQKAILPSQKMMSLALDDYFVLYRPKDIVAGDFYWMEKVISESSTTVYIAACDCTGHGVPGAMVSVVCHNALNRAVREYGLKSTGEILNKTRELVIAEFEKSDEDVKDGMDISILKFQISSASAKVINNEIEWSGANNPLWILRNNSIIEINPDKQPIGKYFDEKEFTTHKVNINKDDIIYLFTDGYSDQFGGEKGKKMKYSNFQKLLVKISNQKMKDQSTILNNEFEKWKGNLEQLDDVCVIGIKIS